LVISQPIALMIPRQHRIVVARAGLDAPARVPRGAADAERRRGVLGEVQDGDVERLVALHAVDRDPAVEHGEVQLVVDGDVAGGDGDARADGERGPLVADATEDPPDRRHATRACR
jgi:hypothetical protein